MLGLPPNPQEDWKTPMLEAFSPVVRDIKLRRVLLASLVAPVSLACGSSNSGPGASGGGALAEEMSSSVGGETAGGGSTNFDGEAGSGGQNLWGSSDGKGGSVGGTSSGGASLGGASSCGASAGGADSGGTNSGGASVGGTGGVDAGGAGSEGTDDRCEMFVYDPESPPKVVTSASSPSSHDPAAIEADGTFYLFSTGLGAWTSTDLTNWRNGGGVFGVPSWMRTAVTGVRDLWAPDVAHFGGQYHLYYSGSVFGKNTSCIGHATRASLSSGDWTDQGSPTICSNISGLAEQNVNWNAIDPNVVFDMQGKPWLAFGSFWDGIELIALDESGERVGDTVTNLAQRRNGGPEGPFIVHRCEYYYLFMSWDKCCDGANSTYNIRVVRSKNIDGPYLDKDGTPALEGGGTLVSEGDSNWAGPGGQSVLFTSDDKAYLVYHAYQKPSGAIRLRIADLVWDADGWPVPVGP